MRRPSAPAGGRAPSCSRLSSASRRSVRAGRTRVADRSIHHRDHSGHSHATRPRGALPRPDGGRRHSASTFALQVARREPPAGQEQRRRPVKAPSSEAADPQRRRSAKADREPGPIPLSPESSLVVLLSLGSGFPVAVSVCSFSSCGVHGIHEWAAIWTRAPPWPGAICPQG
jgi:hypothetical protein